MMELEYNFKYCTSFDDVKELVRYCKQTGYCCNDFETNAEHPIEPTSFATILSISFQPGSAWVVPLFHKDSPLKGKAYTIIRYIGRELIENPAIIKIGQNLKFEYKWWLKYGIKMEGRLIDTMLIKYLLKEERPHGLKEMVDMYIPEFSGYALKGSPSSKASQERLVEFWTNVPIDELSKYGALDADLTFRLYIFLMSRAWGGKFVPLLRNLLMMATRTLAETEWVGMYTDRAYLENLVGVYKQKIDDCERSLRQLPEVVAYEEARINEVKKSMIRNLRNEIRIMKKEGASGKVISNREVKISRLLAGEYTNQKEREAVQPINFGSQLQLIGLFFTSEHGFEWDVVAYTQDKKSKKNTSTPSVAEDVLKILKTKYNHPVLDTLMELRGLLKMNSTYVVGMLEKLHTNNRIHGSFLIHGTVTGRLSSVNPNLQNIPRTTTANDIKPMFVNTPGRLILHLDYSQAELRVMAYLAGEDTMLTWFRLGRDIHTSTACKKYNADYNEVENILEDKNHPDRTTWVIRRKQAKCYSPDTEVLTLSGWQRLDNYDGTKIAQYNMDSEKITFTEPENYGKVLSYNNYTYKDRNIEFEITEDHKTIFINRAGTKIKTEFKNLLGKKGYVPSAGSYINNPTVSDEFTMFIAMFTADGNMKKSGAIRFGFTKVRKINRCRGILNICGFEFTENTRMGNTYFYITKSETNTGKVKDLLRFVNKDKELSWDCLIHIRGDIYLDEAKYWGSSLNSEFKQERLTFYTTVEKTADVMQAMGAIHGIRVIKSEKRKGHFRLSYRPAGRLYSRVNFKNAIHITEMDGKYMYSVTVPDRNLVTRKGGKVFISGNTTNFGIAYEQGALKLAEKLTEQGIPTTKDEAQVILNDWFKDFPKIKTFIKNQHKLVKKQGYVKTLFGRKRRLEESLNSPNKWKQLEAERQSVNAVVQGSASDFALFSSILIREEILKGNLPSTLEQFGTVHDSLLYYVEPKDIHMVIPIMKAICANPETKEWFNFEVTGVSMNADFDIGTTWGNIEKYNEQVDYTTWVTE